MIGHPFKWEPNLPAPQPVQISPITGRPITMHHAWQVTKAVADRRALSRLGKAWRTRRALSRREGLGG